MVSFNELYPPPLGSDFNPNDQIVCNEGVFFTQVTNPATEGQN